VRRDRFIIGTLYWLLPVVVLIAFVGPVLMWVVLTVRSWGNLPSLGTIVRVLGRTFGYSSACALAAVLVAYPLAYLWWTSNDLIRKALFFLMITPLCMGLLARNFAWVALLSNPEGTPARVLAAAGLGKVIYTGLGVVIVMTCVFVPMCYFILVQGFSGIRPSTIEAAITMGATRLRTLIAVVAPITGRAATLAFLFSFTVAAGFFVTPRMIGGSQRKWAGNVLLDYVSLGDFGSASLLSLIFLCAVLLATLPLLFLTVRRRARVVGV
jgi:putative spermidine/putrescine transport system permease protein